MADVAPHHNCMPWITVADGCALTGVGFLPDHDVTVRVAYTDDGASDYLAYVTDSAGEFLAALPTSAAAGTLHISATDHRISSYARGLVWSNTATIDGADSWKHASTHPGYPNARPSTKCQSL